MKCEICEKEKKVNKDGLCVKCQREFNAYVDEMSMLLSGAFVFAIIKAGSLFQKQIDILQGKKESIDE